MQYDNADEDITLQGENSLTHRGNEVFVGTQSLHAALVLIVPSAQGLIISTAHDEPPTRVEQHTTHPVVMAHL